jgi:nicotinate-nucleotide adenylyltransferase
MKKKVGFFGGTFDPIHFGHLNLAVQLMEKGELDEILFCPANCSPFKTAHPPRCGAIHRYQMLVAVLADIPGFRVTPIEIERDGPSYTVDTLRQLKDPHIQFRLLLSEEAAASFDQWKQPDEIQKLAPLLIGSRSDEKPKQGIIQTNLFDISSTEVRARLKKKMYCGHLIPAKALDYIIAHHLYSLSTPRD